MQKINSAKCTLLHKNRDIKTSMFDMQFTSQEKEIVCLNILITNIIMFRAGANGDPYENS